MIDIPGSYSSLAKPYKAAELIDTVRGALVHSAPTYLHPKSPLPSHERQTPCRSGNESKANSIDPSNQGGTKLWWNRVAQTH